MDRLRGFGFLLSDVSRLYVQRFEQRARALGLTLPQSKALVSLSKHEGLSQAQLSELIDIEPMNLCRLLDRMEADGWMERRNDPSDRRARRLYLRPKARPLLEQIQQVSDLTRTDALALLPRADIDRLFDLLSTVHARLAKLKPLAAGAVGSAERESRTTDHAATAVATRKRSSTR